MSDIRISKTQKIIENTFFELLQKKSVKNITIKEICATAQISRSTFYDHYEDFPSLVKSLETAVVDKYLECIKLYHYDTDTNGVLEALFLSIKDNYNLFSLLFNEELSQNTKPLFISKVKEIALPIWEKESSLTSDEIKIIFEYMINGSMALLSMWYNGNTSINEDKFKELYSNVIKYGVYNYIYTI